MNKKKGIMKSDEKLFCDLSALVQNATGWSQMSYRTRLGEGCLLMAPQGITPQPVELNLNLSGWYKIYLCLINFRSDNYTYVKLTDDLCYTGVRTGGKNPTGWCATEYVEEVFWKCANLTGQSLWLAKPNPPFLSTAALVWLRCVPMTQEETIAHQSKVRTPCVQMHFDEDQYAEDSCQKPEDYLIKLQAIAESNVDFCSIEYSFADDSISYDSAPPIKISDSRWTAGFRAYQSSWETIHRDYIKYAGDKGISLFAACRMCVSNFHAPYRRYNLNKKFVEENPQYYCHNRDGSITQVCSYAYPEVQVYMIDQMVRMVELGYDGITMIFHRGQHIGFEPPVLERFNDRYPGIDPHTIPTSDSRLHGVWSYFLTEFMKAVRERLDAVSKDKHIEINVITDYSLETSLYMGIDVALWAKEGLVDRVTQADMETFEDLSGCMSEARPDRIDMDKYRAKLEYEPVIRRNYATNVEKVCTNMGAYIDL